VVDGEVERCGLDRGHDRDHDRWEEESPYRPSRAVAKDDNGFAFQCDGGEGHDGDHHAAGSYTVSNKDKDGTEAHKYDLRWQGMKPSERS